MTHPDPLPFTDARFWRRLAPLWAVVVVAAAAAMFVVFDATIVATRDRKLTEMTLDAERAAVALGVSAADIVSNAQLVQGVRLLELWLDQPAPQRLTEVERAFISIARARRSYDQVLILDTRGMEIMRVNLTDTGAAEATPHDQLQDKSDRDYFVQGVRLAAGSTYVSRVDLNVERGAVEVPHQPALRVALPLFSARGERRGLLVLGHRAQLMVAAAERMLISDGAEFHLLNADGYWLRAPDASKNWGHVLPHGASFAADHPQIWDALLADDRTPQRFGERWAVLRTVRPFAEESLRAAGVADPPRLSFDPRGPPVWHIALLSSNTGLTREAIGAFSGFASAITLAAIVMLVLAWLASAQVWRTERTHDYLASVLDRLPVGIIALDRKLAIEYANPVAAELLGRDRGKLPGKTPVNTAWNVLREDGSPMPPDEYPVNRVRATGEPLRGSVVGIVPADGSAPRWLLVEAYPELARDHTVTGVLVAFADVTAARAAEAMRREQLVAEAASAAKTHFLSRLSHELRTPLNAIIGFTQLLTIERGGLSMEQKQRLSAVEAGGRQLLALVSDAMDLSRIELGQVPLSLDALRVADLVAECVSMVSRQAERAGVRIEAERGDSHWFVRADRVRLQQVLTNVLSNAIKYNRRGGTVHLSVTADDARVLLTVTDTGVGIAPEQMPKLFRAFERLGAEATGIEGTGLGLTISRQLIELMDGRIEIESQHGAGTTVRLQLPRAAPLTLDATVHGPPPAEATPTRSARLLCIEDNLANAQLIREIVAQRSGWSVELRATGRAGIGAAREQFFDLVLCDINLPDLNGHEVIAALRGDERLRSTRFIAVTADASEATRERALRSGYDDVITKPIDVRAFLRLLDRELR